MEKTEIMMIKMTSSEIGELIKKQNKNLIVLLPVGAIEEHGPHLSIGTDSTHAEYIVERAARKITDTGKIHVLVAPTFYYGDVTKLSTRSFPGSIGLTSETLIKAIEDIIKCLLIQKFRNILVVNCHNGNGNTSSIEIALRKLSVEYPNAGLYGVTWWKLGIGLENLMKECKAGAEGMRHACEWETAMGLVINPELVHLQKAIKNKGKYSLSSKYVGATGFDTSKVFYQSRMHGWESHGVMGDPTPATKELGEKIIPSFVDTLAELIVEIVESEE